MFFIRLKAYLLMGNILVVFSANNPMVMAGLANQSKCEQIWLDHFLRCLRLNKTQNQLGLRTKFGQNLLENCRFLKLTSDLSVISERNEPKTAKKWPFKRLFSTGMISIIILLSFYCCLFLARCCTFACACMHSFLVKHGLWPKRIKVIRLFRGARKHRHKNMADWSAIEISSIGQCSAQSIKQINSTNANHKNGSNNIQSIPIRGESSRKI